MTYAIISRRTDDEGSMLPETGVPVHIKVPGRDSQDQPVGRARSDSYLNSSEQSGLGN